MPDPLDDEIARRLAGVRAQEGDVFTQVSGSVLRVMQALPPGWRREIGPKKARRAWERTGADGLPGLFFTPTDGRPIAIVRTDFWPKHRLRPGENVYDLPDNELEYHTGLAVRPGHDGFEALVEDLPLLQMWALEALDGRERSAAVQKAHLKLAGATVGMSDEGIARLAEIAGEMRRAGELGSPE